MQDVYEYDKFVDEHGFNPLDEPDITYHGLQNELGLEARVDAAVKDRQFVSVIDNDVNSDLDVAFGWHLVNVLHRCFIPDLSNGGHAYNGVPTDGGECVCDAICACQTDRSGVNRCDNCVTRV